MHMATCMIHNDEPLSYFVVEQEPTPHLFNRPSTQPNQHSEPGNASVCDPSQQVKTFQKHQMFYLQPSICSGWKQFRDRYIRQKGQPPLILGGDGRADTLGHSAKFGSYGMLDLYLMLVVNIQLVQGRYLNTCKN